jgi:hypothetical protein
MPLQPQCYLVWYIPSPYPLHEGRSRSRHVYFKNSDQTIIVRLASLGGSRGGVAGWGTMLQVIWPHSYSRTMALGSTQPLTQMSTRNILDPSFVEVPSASASPVTLPMESRIKNTTPPVRNHTTSGNGREAILRHSCQNKTNSAKAKTRKYKESEGHRLLSHRAVLLCPSAEVEMKQRSYHEVSVV